MHVHYPPALAVGNRELWSLLFLANGVTTVRETGSIDGSIFGVREAIRDGRFPGPRIFACGAMLDGDPPSFSDEPRRAHAGRRSRGRARAGGPRCRLHQGLQHARPGDPGGHPRGRRPGRPSPGGPRAPFRDARGGGDRRSPAWHRIRADRPGKDRTPGLLASPVSARSRSVLPRTSCSCAPIPEAISPRCGPSRRSWRTVACTGAPTSTPPSRASTRTSGEGSTKR